MNPASLAPRDCEHCGTEFQPTSRRHRFCTQICQQINNVGIPPEAKTPVSRVTVTCGWEPCSKVFVPTNGRAKYCCRVHRLRDWREKNFKAGEPKPVAIVFEMAIEMDPADLPPDFWLRIACPTCKAAAGARCIYPDGRLTHHAGRVTALHVALAERLANDEDLRAAAAATLRGIAYGQSVLTP